MVGELAILLALAAQTPELSERSIGVEFRPLGEPQIAVWLEDAQGNFVDTIMVTRLVGTFGIGNRPGRNDFGGGYLWPYGKRESALPVWAHRRGVEYPRIIFQDCRENGLGWHEIHSSGEPFYCRPITPAENSVDTITCPTSRFTSDKGIPYDQRDTSRSDCAQLDLPPTSFYPPRNDIGSTDATGRDWDGVMNLKDWNDLDAITRATPPSGDLFQVRYQLPATLAAGEYIVWVEVNQDFDANSYHDYDFFVDPMLTDYGSPHRGQPSVVWQVPITVGEEPQTQDSSEYVGYGAPDGLDGELYPPDETITTDLEGSGAGRLTMVGGYQVRVNYAPEAECTTPMPVTSVQFVESTFKSVDLELTMPSEGNNSATIYEIVYSEAHDSINGSEDFTNAVPAMQIPSDQPSRTIQGRRSARELRVHDRHPGQELLRRDLRDRDDQRRHDHSPVCDRGRLFCRHRRPWLDRRAGGRDPAQLPRPGADEQRRRPRAGGPLL